MFINWYLVLDLGEDASPSEIRKAYRQKALLYHPDKNSSIDAPEKFRLINEASAILLDQASREEFDQKLRRNKEQETARPNIQQKLNTHRIRVEQLKLETLRMRLELAKKMRTRQSAPHGSVAILISFRGEVSRDCIEFLAMLPGFVSCKQMGAHLTALFQDIVTAEQAFDQLIKRRSDYLFEYARVQTYANRPNSPEFLEYIRGRLNTMGHLNPTAS